MTPLDVFGMRKRPGEIGIEIEVEGVNLYINKMDYWKVVHDGSLRGEEAVEYILSSPIKRKEIPKVLKYIKGIWTDSSSRIDTESPRTSVHIHINVQELSFSKIINYFCLYSIFEDLLVKFCGPNREGNLFCLRLRDADYLLDFLTNIIKANRWDRLNTNDIRYASVNMAAIAKYGSMEFRAMRGTADITLIQKWIYMLLCLKDKAIMFERPSDIITTFSQVREKQFLNEIMGEFSKELDAPNRNLSMRNGVRRILEIAYLPIKEEKKKEVKDKVPPIARVREGWERVNLDIERANLIAGNRGPVWLDANNMIQWQHNPMIIPEIEEDN